MPKGNRIKNVIEIPAPGDNATIRAGREWLHVYLDNGGADCPLCHQRAQVYHRTLGSGVARVLICMYNMEATEADEHGYMHLPSLPVTSHESAQAQWWGLIEEKPEERADGGRAGWWRLTEKGRQFVRGEIDIPSHAVVFNGRLLQYDLDKKHKTIQDCLGKKFDLNDLLIRRFDPFNELP